MAEYLKRSPMGDEAQRIADKIFLDNMPKDNNYKVDWHELMRSAGLVCHMCGKPIMSNIKVFGDKLYDEDCYEIGTKRVLRFLEKVTLPDAEFEQWLEGDD
jgi:hypothetical protein